MVFVLQFLWKTPVTSWRLVCRWPALGDNTDCDSRCCLLFFHPAICHSATTSTMQGPRRQLSATSSMGIVEIMPLGNEDQSCVNQTQLKNLCIYVFFKYSNKKNTILYWTSFLSNPNRITIFCNLCIDSLILKGGTCKSWHFFIQFTCPLWFSLS